MKSGCRRPTAGTELARGARASISWSIIASSCSISATRQKTKDQVVLAIFTDAQTKLRKPTNLKALTDAIDKLDWFSAREEGLGNLYEGLLEKNAAEKKSGAGQYFTPRPLIDCIVRLDEAASRRGRAGPRRRHRRISRRRRSLHQGPDRRSLQADRGAGLLPAPQRLRRHRACARHAPPLPDEPHAPRHREQVESGDTLSPDGERLGKADVILTNPPFGTKKGGGRPTRSDFSITADTSNKQLAFVEHIVRALKPGGRAAVVVPDNVLFEDSVGRRLRSWMMELCNLHTILRLPTGIFYAQGVKTNVVFLTRGKTDHANTKGVWVYDMRANMDAFGKTRPLTLDDFKPFEKGLRRRSAW